ncbi:GDP-mannose 4,6-dehydratase [Patescibacteria group bacterium]|nr:GDP-mannose 4,6-dehydratase [Patescibacteria group bacterium]MBU1499929.1 GDP-mannose 4,6-dehydratase [Patescibacteria group bacterium]
MKKNILVTGGLGFIGSHLLERLIELNYSVSVIDNLSAGSTCQPPKQVKFFCQDISDPKVIDLVVKLKPQVIIHLAADNRVTSTQAEALKSNVIGTFNLLEAGKKAGIKQFIFSSSAAVYGDPASLPINETHPTRPISAYGLSKLTGELYCHQYQSDFKTSVFRFSNVYGPRQSSGSEGGIVSILIDRLLKGKKPIIYGNGQQTRDFIFVGDIVEAMILALSQPQSFTLNLGSNQSTKIITLLKTISRLMKVKPEFIKKPFRPMEIKHSLFDYSKAQKTLSWQPKTKLTAGLYETINYFTSL